PLFAADATRRLRILYRCKRGTVDSVLKVGSRLADNWFGLFVGNAIGAMVSAIVAYYVGQFSYLKVFWGWLVAVVQPSLLTLGAALLGEGRMDTLQGWWSWYGENQIRFLFWFLYVAAICDDLGVPSFKTLARRIWRKITGS